MSGPKILSKRLSLRPMKSKDIFLYTDLLSDKETMELMGGPPLTNLLDVKDEVEKKKYEYERGISIFWVITIKDENEFVGFVRIVSYQSNYFEASYKSMGELMYSSEFLSYIDKENGWEIDYAILKDYRGHGIMSEAIQTVLEYCQENNLSPIYAKVNKLTNKATVNILKKYFFKELLPQVGFKGEPGMIYKWQI